MEGVSPCEPVPAWRVTPSNWEKAMRSRRGATLHRCPLEGGSLCKPDPSGIRENAPQSITCGRDVARPSIDFIWRAKPPWEPKQMEGEAPSKPDPIGFGYGGFGGFDGAKRSIRFLLDGGASVRAETTRGWAVIGGFDIAKPSTGLFLRGMCGRTSWFAA